MKKVLIFFICILFSPFCCYAIEPIPTSTLDSEPILLGNKSEHLLTTQDATFEEILSDKFKNKFVNIEKNETNYGYISQACWVHFSLKNKLKKRKDVVIEIGYPLLDYIDFYYFKTNSPQNVTTIKTGDKLTLSKRPIKHRKFLFPIEIKEEIQVYIRIQTSGSLKIPIKIWTPESFFLKDRSSYTFSILYFGMVLVLFFYHLFVFGINKDKSNLFYVLHIVAAIFGRLAIDGFSSEIWPNLTFWNNMSLPFFLGIYFLTLLLFAQDYLKIRLYLPKINSFIKALIIFCIGLIILPLFGFYTITIIINCLLGIFIPFLLFFSAMFIGPKYKPARYFVVAFFIYLIGIIAFALMSLGVLPENNFTSHAIQLGSALEFIILSLGLTSIINLLKEEIEDKNKELTRLSRLKDDFLSNTTHELKTPLHGIMGIAEALKNGIAGELTQKAKSNLAIIINSAQRLSLLVNDILDVQRLKNQDIELNLSSFDLNQVVNVVISVSQPLLKDKPVELKNSILPETIFVRADSNRLYQIIQNLVSNACKFTESGFIEISAKKENSMISIAVSDTGVGISSKDQKRIFRRFEQVEHMSIGSGLGLSISKTLIELHGGSTFLNSKVGKGSQFVFTIPSSSKAIQNEEVQPPKMLNYVNDAQVISENSQKLQGMQILIVDDEPVNLKVVSDYLLMNNYKVRQCSSGQGAIQYLKDHKPDLVLLDVMMPETDGFSVCKKIREKYSHCELPVIFLTAKNQVTDLVQGFSFGGNDYLTKPFSKEELLARVGCQLAISKAKDRLVSLRAFANKISKLKNFELLSRELFKYVIADSNVEFAATFLNKNLVKCTDTKNKKESIKIFERWNIEGYTPDGFIFLGLKEFRNFVVLIKMQIGSSSIDMEYLKNLEAQAATIIRNFRQLVSDTNFLADIHTIKKFKKNIRFIRAKNKETILYEDLHDQKIYLKSSLNTIECFFNNDLIRVSRSCLINPKKIVEVNKAKKNGKKYLINVDGEKISVTQKIIDTLAEV